MIRAWSLAALIVTALSLGPSFAHVLEAPPRLLDWPPELWREATVFHGQFRLFGILGGPLDGGAVLVTAGLAFVLRGRRLTFAWALAGAVLFAGSLAVWLAWVAPANGILATWRPGPIPADFQAVRDRWETGHMVIAGLKLLGLVAIALAVLPRDAGPRQSQGPVPISPRSGPPRPCGLAGRRSRRTRHKWPSRSGGSGCCPRAAGPPACRRSSALRRTACSPRRAPR